MKRGGPIRRKNPLRPKPVLKANGQQRARPTKKATAWRLVAQDVEDRSKGRCEAVVAAGCTRIGEHLHHVILRSRGGPDEAWNLLHVCHACHDWIHREVAKATELGLMRPMTRQNPAAAGPCLEGVHRPEGQGTHEPAPPAARTTHGI